MGTIIIYEGPTGFHAIPCKKGASEEEIKKKVSHRIRGGFGDAMRKDESPLKPTEVAQAIMEYVDHYNIKFWEYHDSDYFDVLDITSWKDGLRLQDVIDKVQEEKGWCNF